MEKEQFEEIREFARRLTEKRLQMPDGQLLDQCQQHLDALVAYIEDNFEEHPHENAGHSGKGPKLASNFDEPPPEPEPPPPAEHEPEHHHVAAHKAVPHKRPTPRKTHR